MISSEKMWVSGIEISGLAGSDKIIKYELNSDINIFFGANGSGKTSLLKILNAAATNTTANLVDVPFQSAKMTINYFGQFILERSIENTSFTKIDEKTQPDLPTVGGLLSDYQNTVAVPTLRGLRGYGVGQLVDPLEWESSMYRLWNGKSEPFKKGEKIDYILPHQYLPTSRLYLGLVPKTTWDSHELTEQELEQNFSERIKELWKEYNYELARTEADAQAYGLARIMKDVWSPPSQNGADIEINIEHAYNRVSKFLNRREPDLANILESLENFKKRIDGQKYLKNIVKDINDVEEAIEKAMMPRTKLNDMITKLYGEKVKLTIEEKKEIKARTVRNKEISLGALSSGQKQLLMILLSTLMAKDKPILVDEPEMSMHVQWQSELVTAMNQLTPSAQIIMATHSPEISASVDDDKLFRL
jgi:predicted ATP-dependent endonuclease of OLD family